MELIQKVSWDDTKLNTCFWLGLDDPWLRLVTRELVCLPLMDFKNVVLQFTGSNFEVEIAQDLTSNHPVPTRNLSSAPAHPKMSLCPPPFLIISSATLAHRIATSAALAHLINTSATLAHRVPVRCVLSPLAPKRCMLALLVPARCTLVFLAPQRRTLAL